MKVNNCKYWRYIGEGDASPSPPPQLPMLRKLFSQRLFCRASFFRADKIETRMWADAQHDGRPAQTVAQIRSFYHAAVWLTPTARVPCSNAANTERKTWVQSEFCNWQTSVRV